MDHENSDDKNGSIIQETEGQRTEMSASSDVVVKSEPSMAPHDNFNTVTRIPENSEVHFAKPERVSPAPSCLSMRSDTSMGRPINFRESVMMKQDRGVSPAVSNVSMRSDWLDHPFNFKRELTTPDSGVGASPAPSWLSMKSDWSMGHPGNFKRELTTPDLGVGASPAPSCMSMRSDWSMGLPFNFRECLNELSYSLLTSDYVTCSLCSSILSNPVSIPCGHSYCKHCINIHWSQPGPTGHYVCLLCNKSYPSRPVLSVNVALNWTLQALQETSFSPACPTLPQAGPGDVACDICFSHKLRAVKTCVTCSASYCEIHVRQHYTVPTLRKHTLVQVNEDTRLSQWEENSGRMEDIKEMKESFVDSESEEHQEVACKRMKMEVEKEDEMFQQGNLEHSDLKNVSTHLQPEEEQDRKYVRESEMDRATSAMLRLQSLIEKAIRQQSQRLRDLKYLSESDIERATSAILRLQSLVRDLNESESEFEQRSPPIHVRLHSLLCVLNDNHKLIKICQQREREHLAKQPKEPREQ